MGTRTDAPAVTAAVELILVALEADNAPLAIRIFEEHNPAQRERISRLVRRRLLPEVIHLARSRRV